MDDTATAPQLGLPPSTPTSSSSDELKAGQQLGHFRVERKLGAGGMGEVYLATDLALDRPVALKVLPDAMSRDPSRRDRLIREARAQARVNHPNVGHIYFIGEDAGRLYFAMEYVKGGTLGERIADGGPIPPDEALSLVRAAALGLREAQRAGFTHRDVKPSNLMIDAHGVVKVLDFGLASGGGDAIGDGPVAQTSMAGTPLYMAPEQGRGDPVDFRADIYALGATLFHLVAGAPPFMAETMGELQSMHSSAKRPTVPRGKTKTKKKQPRLAINAVDTLCSKMMAAKAEDRFASYDDLVRAIELASTTHTHPAGFWARSIAMTIDLTIAMVVSALVGLLVSTMSDYELDIDVVGYVMLGIAQTIGVARYGRTAGKSLLALEVVSMATQKRPSVGQSAIRAIALLGVPTALGASARILDVAGMPNARDLFGQMHLISLPLLLIALIVAAFFASGKRSLWDRAAGTIVRYRRER